MFGERRMKPWKVDGACVPGLMGHPSSISGVGLDQVEDLIELMIVINVGWLSTRQYRQEIRTS